MCWRSASEVPPPNGGRSNAVGQMYLALMTMISSESVCSAYINNCFISYYIKKTLKKTIRRRLLYGEQQDREQQRKERLLKRFREDCVVKAFPRTKADFDVLFAQVQKWKESEVSTNVGRLCALMMDGIKSTTKFNEFHTIILDLSKLFSSFWSYVFSFHLQLARIGEMYAGAPRNAELYLLLEREINLLNGIERQRAKVRQHVREQQIEKDLDEMGMPIKWIGYRGIFMDEYWPVAVAHTYK